MCLGVGESAAGEIMRSSVRDEWCSWRSLTCAPLECEIYAATGRCVKMAACPSCGRATPVDDLRSGACRDCVDAFDPLKVNC